MSSVTPSRIKGISSSKKLLMMSDVGWDKRTTYFMLKLFMSCDFLIYQGRIKLSTCKKLFLIIFQQWRHDGIFSNLLEW